MMKRILIVGMTGLFLLHLVSASPVWAIKVGHHGPGLTTEEIESHKIRREGLAQEVMERKDSEPPLIAHQPRHLAKRGEPFTVSAEVFDASGVQTVRLFYRARGQDSFSTLRMDLQRGDSYTSTIPEYDMIGEGIDYYLSAVDLLGNGPAFSGSEHHPYLLQFGVKQGSMISPFGCIFFIWGVLALFLVTRMLRKDPVVG